MDFQGRRERQLVKYLRRMLALKARSVECILKSGYENIKSGGTADEQICPEVGRLLDGFFF